MVSHDDVDVRNENVEWASLEMAAEEKSVSPTRFEKLLGFAPSFQVVVAEGMESAISLNYQSYIEDDIELMEEDVWGQDDDMSSFDGNTMPSSNQWPDSESDSHFSASHDEGGNRRSRFAGIFSPSQFSPIGMNDREAMRGRHVHSLHIMTSQFGEFGTISNARQILGMSPHHSRLLYDVRFSNESFSSGDCGPRSAPIDVPLCSRLYAQVDDNTEDDDDLNDTHRVPPHKLLAKQFARSQISAFSVIEGAGRTLKGRDASEVRDAVWKQTGFFG